jgi:pimeloyl-ACP methyl ester carboxylesterase
LAQTISERFNSTTIFMLRPGYRGNFGKSDGYANREDDDYSKENVEYMAGALRGLRQAHSGKKVVMVGHSGGSAMTALLLAFHPELIEAVVLAGCPCDVGPWRRRRAITAHRSDIPWTNSLSPLDNTKQVSKQAVVIAITGENDNNTVPQFSQAYIAALQRNGVEKVQFVLAAGASHGSVLGAPEFFEAIQSAVLAVSNPPD